MATPWNYERRQVTCAKFIVGVWLIAKGKVGFETTLEAVRNRVRLPPEDALFAARRLDEEQLVAFEPGGDVRALAKGMERAEELLAKARAIAGDPGELARAMSRGGVALETLKLAVLVHGGSLECPPSDEGTPQRLVLTGDELAVERHSAVPFPRS